MKKKIALTIASVLILSLSFSMAGCTDDKIAKLAPDYEGKYNISVSESVGGLFSLDYQFGESDGNGLVVVSSNNGGITSYQLFDIVAQKFISGTESKTPIYLLDEGLFYSATSNDVTTSYTLYSRMGMKPMGVGSVNQENGFFTSATNNVRTYVDIKGNIVEEDDPFNEIFNKAKADECVKVGNYYLSGFSYDYEDVENSYSNSNITVYNSKGQKVRTINPTLRLGLSSNSQVNFFNARWSIGNKIFFQVTTELPYMEDSYDYYKNNSKYDIITYSYNVKSDKLSKVKDFDYEVQSVYRANESNVVLEVCEIKNKQIINQPFLQAFNSKGKVSVDIQGLAPGVTHYGYEPISNYSVLYAEGYTHIYDGNKHLRTLARNQFDAIIDNYIVKETQDEATNSNTLTLYNIVDASESMPPIPYVTEWTTTYNNNILYQTTNNQVCLFDVKARASKALTTLDLDQSASVYNNDHYFAAYANGAKTYYFMDSSIPNLVVTAETDNIQEIQYFVDGTRYQIIKSQQGNVYSYKMIAFSYPYIAD